MEINDVDIAMLAMNDDILMILPVRQSLHFHSYCLQQPSKGRKEKLGRSR